jgi:N-acetylneuraminic acid mutarotase
VKYTLNRIAIILILSQLLVFLSLTFIHSFAFASDVWSPTTPLPYNLSSHTSFALDDKFYIIDGSAVTGQSKYATLTSTPNADGSISTWNNISLPMPSALIWHATATKNRYVYVLGGKEENPGSLLSHVNKVFLGEVNNFGAISSWSTLTPLPVSSSNGAAAVIGDRIYFAGGANDFGVNQKVFVANINSDGTIGNWQIAGLLPEPLDGFGMIANGDNLIIVGGHGSIHGFLGKTYKTSVDPANGTISSWQETATLPNPVVRGGVIKVGSKLYVIGGIDGTNFLDTIYYSNINSDGTLSPWTTGQNHLPQPICCGAVASVNDYIYLTGGYNNAGYHDTVYYSSIEDILGVSADTLSVPYFSQNELPWGPSEYDHTYSLGVTGISGSMDWWGCAVTSATMVLRYHGMTEMLDGTAIDPASLNQWLNAHDGYSYGKNKKGWYSSIWWNTISRLTQELYDGNKSSVKLEFSNIQNNASFSALLNNDLTTGNDVGRFPDILHVTKLSGSSKTIGHYVVAKGATNDTYEINDPEWNYPTLASFESYYDQLIRYVPSHTNLSYIDIIVNPNIQILITSPDGKRTGKVVTNGQTQSFNEIPNANYFYQPPIANPDALGVVHSLGTGVNEFLLPKPNNGKYKITFSSNENSDYMANFATYKKDGTSNIKVINGLLGKNQTDIIEINYDSDTPSQTNRIVDFESTIRDINELYDIRSIKTVGAATSLKALIQTAQKNYITGKENNMQENLRVFEKLLNTFKDINQQAYDILLYDVKYLQDNY